MDILHTGILGLTPSFIQEKKEVAIYSSIKLIIFMMTSVELISEVILRIIAVDEPWCNSKVGPWGPVGLGLKSENNLFSYALARPPTMTLPHTFMKRGASGTGDTLVFLYLDYSSYIAK